MLDPDASGRALERFFTHQPVAVLTELGRVLGTRSRMSVFRRLSALGYLSSYTHNARYYTLRSVPDFDADGLWRWQGVGFSRDCTLKATVQRIVQTSDAGHTQRELQLRLGVRVHNPLLELIETKALGREAMDGEYLYLAAKRKRAAAQLERRRALAATTPPEATLEVEVLLEVIHGAQAPTPDATALAARLEARGIRATVADVAAVLEHHGLKKTPPSRSRRSKH